MFEWDKRDQSLINKIVQSQILLCLWSMVNEFPHFTERWISTIMNTYFVPKGPFMKIKAMYNINNVYITFILWYMWNENVIVCYNSIQFYNFVTSSHILDMLWKSSLYMNDSYIVGSMSHLNWRLWLYLINILICYKQNKQIHI